MLADDLAAKNLAIENEALRIKLAEAQELISAIRSGEVDAVVVSGPQGEQVFTLKDAEYSYRALVEEMNEGAASLTLDGTILYCNQRLAKLVGIPLEQIMGSAAARLFTVQDAQMLNDLLHHVSAGHSATAELTLSVLGRPSIPVYISLRAMKTSARGTLSMVVTDLTERNKHRDHLEEMVADRTRELQRVNAKLRSEIVERERQQQALRESEERFSKTFYGSPNAMILTRVDDHILLNANDSFLRLFEYTREEAIGRKVGEDLQLYCDPERECAEIVRLTNELGRVPSHEVRMRTNAGNCLTALFSSELISFTGEERVACTTMIDITSRKQMEEALHESEERTRSIMENSTEILYRVDLRTGRYDFMTISAERLLEYPLEEFYNLTYNDTLALVHPDDVPGIREGLKKLEAEGHAQVEYRHRVRSGGYRWFSTNLTLTRDADGVPRYRNGYCRDVTERKRAELALIRSEKLASAGRLAASIAHEINNPLEAVTNMLFLLRAVEGMPEFARSMLETADSELQRIAHITRQSLGFYQESQGVASAFVGEVLKSAVDLLRGKIKARRAKIKQTWRRDVEIVAVIGELRQIFSNLIANSLDAIDEGGIVTLRVVAVSGTNQARPSVRITIADNGRGIDSSDQPHIFEPFFTTKGRVGTGLGLWVSKQLIEKHRGAIRIRSNTAGAYRGTVVSIVLPLNPVPLPAAEPQDA